MASKITQLIPRHTVYCEPFCGGATILFTKPWPNVSNKHHYREIINDIDSRLINFYEQLIENGDELIRRIQLTLHSEEKHRDSLRGNFLCEDKIEAARRYYVNVMQSFSKKLNGGWARCVFSENVSATWAKKLANLPQYLERMASVQVCNQDALKVIRQFDSPQTFFYCDPPYPNTECGDYSGYTVEDLKALVETLNQCQGSFILSNYDQPGVAVPLAWERIVFDSHCSSSGRGKVGADRSRKPTAEELGNRKRTEVIWRRFNRVPVRPEIQKLYDSGAFDCFVSGEERDNDSWILGCL